MKAFQDNAGRTWLISINVFAVKRVRALLGIDLYSLIDEEMKELSKLLTDPCSLVDVIFVLCSDEAGKLGISDEDFGRAMAGDAIQQAAEAFLAELVDFFPDPKVRKALQRVIEASRKVRDALLDRMEVKLDQIDVESEATKLIDSSGNSPVASESTPPRIRFANW